MNHKPLILCADDSTNILEGWKMLLELKDYRVLTATDGKEALQAFVSHPIDLVLLDYHMPHMDGDVVATYMKTYKPDVPIALLSGEDLTPLANLKSVDAFVSKSESVPRVLEIVDHLLNLHFLFQPLEGWEGEKAA
jgi:CheY-like chemotaxis protein